MSESKTRPVARSVLLPLVSWLAAVVTLGLLLFAYRYLAVLSAGAHEPYLRKLIEEMSSAFVIGALFFPVRAFVRRLPISSANWTTRLPAYFVAALLFGATATTLMWGTRSVISPLVGLGPYHYGLMPIPYLMELPLELIVFSVVVLAVQAFDAFRDAREREVHAARLESHLAHAQLRNLRLQLQPHFLFNALNTISSTMYRDPAAADEMLAELSELLRASLQTSQADEVTLQSELHVLQQYLALMKARFGERLDVAVEVDGGVELALVPSMILQPLVENAVRHGNATHVGRGRIRVRAAGTAHSVVLEVLDDGPGLPEGKTPAWGVGLTATAERLRLLYGDRQRLETGPSKLGGFRIAVTLPLHTAITQAAGEVAS